jgi:ABC-type Na+ efflux pump permease subunit
MLRDAWFIARKDLAYMLKQRETILWVFLMPPLFFYFIGTVTAGFGGGGGDDSPDPIALVATFPEAREGFLVGEIGRRLAEQDFRVDRFDSEEAATAYDRRLVLPAPPAAYSTFTEAVLDGWEADIVFRREGDDLNVDFDQVRVRRAVWTVLADVVAVRSEGGNPGPESFAELDQRARVLTLRVESAGRRARPPVGFEQAIPGTLVMFTMLVLLTSGAMLLVIEREEGLLKRLAATPISRSSLVLGKWTSKMTLGVVQIAFGVLLGALAFGIDWGQALPAVGIVLVAWAAFNASLGIFLANTVRSRAQMGAVGVLASMVLAALGGCWWPIEITPGWMQGLAGFLPTGWAMDAMHKLVSFGEPGTVALPHTGTLAAAALLLGWLASRRFRYQ